MSLPVITRPAAPGTQWTEQEDEILRQLYPRMIASEVAERLPGRTEMGVVKRAYKLGMPRKKSSIPSAVEKWDTPKGIEKLRKLTAKHGGVIAVAAAIGVSESTLRRWTYNRPAMREALGLPAEVREHIEQPVVIEPEKPKPRKRKPSKCAKCVWAKELVKSGSHVLCMWPECIKEGQL